MYFERIRPPKILSQIRLFAGQSLDSQGSEVSSEGQDSDDDLTDLGHYWAKVYFLALWYGCYFSSLFLKICFVLSCKSPQLRTRKAKSRVFCS